MNFGQYQLASVLATRDTGMNQKDIADLQQILGFLKLFLAKTHGHTYMHTHTHIQTHTHTHTEGIISGRTPKTLAIVVASREQPFCTILY